MTQAWIDIVARSFRREYKFPVSAAKNWFPGHMNRGLKDMQRRIKNVDCIIEVHDARIPLSGRNSAFKAESVIVKKFKFQVADLYDK